jgi:hypothetical protein
VSLQRVGSLMEMEGVNRWKALPVAPELVLA